jgi:3-phosphoshikimate 1-carboxyvinyltransferase
LNARITPHIFNPGIVRVPASKSHAIRRLIMAALTNEESRIENLPESLDVKSCINFCKSIGAKITEVRDEKSGLPVCIVRGINYSLTPNPCPLIDIGNSGTTLFLGLAVAALFSVPVTFDGDEQIRRRSAAPLLDALRGLGINVESRKDDDGKETGCAPLTVGGAFPDGTQSRWRGGRISIECPTSQYLSALLLAAPLAPAGTVTEIDVPLLNEKPYIKMTLAYLEAQDSCSGKLAYKDDFSYFRIEGGCAYKPIAGPVPGDFSSAAFPAAAAAISGGSVTLAGLVPDDVQGDKVFFDCIKEMGCDVEWGTGNREQGIGNRARRKNYNNDEYLLHISRKYADGKIVPLRGEGFDLNATPDMLPAMAAVGAFAEGVTKLTNVAHARIKETDRVAVMASELGKLGVKCEERPDGLIVYGNTFSRRTSDLPGMAKEIELDGYGDHRIVMALACAALGLGEGAAVVIKGAEAADVTYPGFLDLV